MNDDKPVSAACRFIGPKCFYLVAGTEEFVQSNYKQHLRESHKIAKPIVMDDELCRVKVVASAETLLEAGCAA